MRIRNYQQMARELKADPRRFKAELTEALAAKELTPEDFSIRECAEHFVEDGREWVRSMDPRFGGGTFVESMDAVNSTHFANITGQIAFSRIMAAAQSEDNPFSATIPTQSTSLSGERIPGITGLGDTAEIVNEGAAYPRVGVSEDYIETPATTKRGHIVPVTKEAIFFDQTGELLNRCSKVGESLAQNKEKRAIDCVIDENTTAHRYKWRGTTIATYGDSSGSHNWDNLESNNGLVDYTDVEKLELLLAAIVDPNTGEPITVMADTLICTPQLVHTARSIINATMIRLQAGGFATSGDLLSRESPNPLGGGPFSANYKFLTSRLMAARLGTDTSWFLGNPSKAFVYMENWPITVVQAPQNSEEEFTNDIVVRYKASERGAYATLDPRLMAKATA